MENNIISSNYKNAFAEVDFIINNSDAAIVNSIPTSFLSTIKKYKNNNYNINIITEVSLESQNLLEETKSILALIYREFIANEEEKKDFLIKDQEEFFNIDEQKKVKYSILEENIFEKQRLLHKDVLVETLDLKVIDEKSSFIRKIINKIKKFFIK